MPNLLLTLELDEEVWGSIAPIKWKNQGVKDLRQKNYLQSGWTDIITKALREKVPLRCPFNLKKKKDKRKKIFCSKLKVTAVSAVQFLKDTVLWNLIQNLGIRISATVPDTRGIPHNQKRRYTGIKNWQLVMCCFIRKRCGERMLRSTWKTTILSQALFPNYQL